MDDTAHCHFIAPAIHQKGDITVAVSTAGKAPAFAVRLRDAIAHRLSIEDAELVDLLGELREECDGVCQISASRKALWYRMVDSEAIEHLREGNAAGARAHLLDIISETCVRRERTVGVAGMHD